MTVAELISELLAMPQEAEVIYRCCSEYTVLDSGDARLVKEAERKIVLHRGLYMAWDSRYKKPEDPDPQFVTVVALPGN